MAHKPTTITFLPTHPQSCWLLREAKRLGISRSDLLRRIIDQSRGTTEGGYPEDFSRKDAP